jgi:hypothetical protein
VIPACSARRSQRPLAISRSSATAASTVQRLPAHVVAGGAGDQWHAAGMAADGLTLALEDYQRAQHELVEARNRLARAIAGAAMSGMTRDEIVDLTGYPADLVLRICRDAGISGD